jgi:hypothetical protein
MPPTGSRTGFYDRAPLRSCANPLLCDVRCWRPGVNSHRQVEAEVSPVIASATSSGHTTSKRSNTMRIWSFSSNPSRVAYRAK